MLRYILSNFPVSPRPCSMTRLSLQEMAARFNLSARTFAAHVRRDEHFPRFIIGKRFYFDPASGQLLCIEHGSYSDYEVIGFFVVLQDFDPKAKAWEYIQSAPGYDDSISLHNAYIKDNEFLAFLLKQGLLLEIEYHSLDLGEYGRYVDISFT